MGPGARLVEGYAGGLPFVLLGDLFSGELLATRLALCRQGGEADARFFVLQTRRFGIEFSEYLPSPDRPAHNQVGRHDPACHRSGDGMHGLVDFQAGRLGDFIHGDAGAHEPDAPAPQERTDYEQAGQ